MEIDDQLATLLQTMSLGKRWNVSQRDIESEKPLLSLSALQRHDVYMSDSSDSEDSIDEPHQPVSSPQPSASTNSTPAPPPPSIDTLNGCRLLQYVQHCLHSGTYQTCSGDYLETIFTHREVSLAYPEGHRQCAIGFSELASELEAREWRADRDHDGDAVQAFRHEAQWVAHACGC